ncbi:MAG: hypothetical protein M1833_004115 [Piccolia ochrophora]|nr:MAG: hypothetical protein M1833_004115 [Piccolia ochrophora]
MPPPKLPFTHFLCLPLVTETSRPQLQASLQSFSDDVVVSSLLDGVDNVDRVVRPPGTIHLTLGMMSLMSHEKLAGAVQLLQDLDLRECLRESAATSAEASVSATASESSTQYLPLQVSLTSVTSMHDPAKTSILYSEPVDLTGRLIPFCTRLRAAFEDAEFVVSESRPLRLHATILNTVYAKTKNHYRRRPKRITIDAINIVENYRDFEFATDIQLDKVRICKMGAQKVFDEDAGVFGEEYEVVGEKSI